MSAAGETVDLLVVGGGINGCGIARDAVGRGLSVVPAEQGDLASGTSSASTKLIHGGLRYLENYEFALVRKALIEREVFWSIAPDLIRPVRFVLPQVAEHRPAWLLRLGLFIYGHFTGRKALPGTRGLHSSIRSGPKQSKTYFGVVQSSACTSTRNRQRRWRLGWRDTDRRRTLFVV